jgi:hypothetical protein
MIMVRLRLGQSACLILSLPSFDDRKNGAPGKIGNVRARSDGVPAAVSAAGRSSVDPATASKLEEKEAGERKRPIRGTGVPGGDGRCFVCDHGQHARSYNRAFARMQPVAFVTAAS